MTVTLGKHTAEGNDLLPSLEVVGIDRLCEGEASPEDTLTLRLSREDVRTMMGAIIYKDDFDQRVLRMTLAQDSADRERELVAA